METEKRKQVGKQKRAQGKAFELRVRKDLEKSWTVNRWSNDIKENELIPAKTSWRRTKFGMFPLNISPGFPDFMCFRVSDSIGPHNYCEVIAVECKLTGTLDKPEKDKCKWLLKNKIFSKILIASKTKVKNKIVVKYEDFEQK